MQKITTNLALKASPSYQQHRSNQRRALIDQLLERLGKLHSMLPANSPESEAVMDKIEKWNAEV